MSLAILPEEEKQEIVSLVVSLGIQVSATHEDETDVLFSGPNSRIYFMFYPATSFSYTKNQEN